MIWTRYFVVKLGSSGQWAVRSEKWEVGSGKWEVRSLAVGQVSGESSELSPGYCCGV